MAQSQSIRWYGYQHVNGTLHVKRYVGHFGSGDMIECKASPFVRDVWGPFEAQNQHRAKLQFEKLVKQQEDT
jgi:hypothetical protein